MLGFGEGPLGNPKLTFDQFVIGDCNRLAHAAALAVAEMPAQAYNPLFICGPPGVGKTHLLSAIANLVLVAQPRARPCADDTGEAFTNGFLGALAGGHTDSFKARFRDIDVLLVDDVQFLERKTRTEEEFFHTFNALHDGGRQIVLTSDRPPHDLQALEDRLRERFQAGLVAEIKPPDLPRAWRSCASASSRTASSSADERRARADRGPRRRQHARARGSAHQRRGLRSLTGRPLTAELAREVLDGLYPAARRARSRSPTVEEIQEATCRRFGVSCQELLSPSRARARRVAATGGDVPRA